MAATTFTTAVLTAAPVTMMLPVREMNRARAFYEHKLGLEPVGLKPDGKFLYACGGGEGAVIALFPKDAGTKADHTALSFQVPDIALAVRELEEKGVIFEEYDLPGLKTVDHVCVLGSEKAAWFKDTEGNFLCIHEELS
jgi:catechol 2,3-dioxygenase-like lactoylglutathione lyase family enzyme